MKAWFTFFQPRDIIYIRNLDGYSGGEQDELDRFRVRPNAELERLEIDGRDVFFIGEFGYDLNHLTRLQ